MSGKILVKNKKAYHDYEILEKFEAGVILTGAEVKSVKGGHVQLKGSYATVSQGRVITENLHISPYKYSANVGYNPLRQRELLLRRKEIDYLGGLIAQKSYTLIPLEIFLKNNLIKILLGVCRGKKAYDKRAELKRRALEKEVQQGLKKFSR